MKKQLIISDFWVGFEFVNMELTGILVLINFNANEQTHIWSIPNCITVNDLINTQLPISAPYLIDAPL